MILTANLAIDGISRSRFRHVHIVQLVNIFSDKDTTKAICNIVIRMIVEPGYAYAIVVYWQHGYVNTILPQWLVAGSEELTKPPQSS
jgi:hypothetical protein